MALSPVHRAAPVLVVAAVATAVLLNSGVELGQLARWVGYELVWVVAPGVVAVLALVGPQRDGPRLLALGWAAGLTLEVLAHVVFARVGLRDVFPGWPLLVAAIAGPLVWRRRADLRRAPSGERPRHSGAALVAAIACAMALVYLAAGWFTVHPLPDKVASVTYYTDAVFDISVTAEAMNHAPLTNPGVSGFAFPYHDWVFHHGAAAAEITGLDLSVVVLRMIPASLFVLVALGLTVAGRGLGRSPWAGALAVVLMLALGDLDPWRDKTLPWGGSWFENLYQSPTYLMGLALFLPVVLLVGERLRGDESRSSVRVWALVALLLVGCVGAKATILPVLMGGLGLTGVWVLCFRRDLLGRVVLAGALPTAIFAIAYLVKYTGRGAGYEVDPLATFQAMEGVGVLRDRLGDWVDAVSFVPGTIGLVGLILFGAVAAVGRRTLRADQVFLAGLFVIGLGALFVLATNDGTQFWIVWYGVAAGALLAAQGLLRIARERRVLLLGVAAVLAIVSALDQPLDRADVREDINAEAPGVQHYRPSTPTNRGLTAGVLEGLRWIRDHSSPDDVLVVNEHVRDGYFDSRYFYYSAFSERRVFLESWLYTSRAAEVGYEKIAEGKAHPFPGRLRDNNRVLETGDPDVVRRLADEHDVRWLVEDRRFEARAPGFARAGIKRFENSDIVIYEVRRP